MEIGDFITGLNEKYGTTDDDWYKIRKAAIVTFEYDDRGNVSGRYKGILVLRDKNYKNVILPGETWICSLEQNLLMSNNYYARPLQRIDSSFMFELKKEQLGEIAETIWEKHRDSIEPLMEDRYGKAIAEEISNAVAQTKAEYESQLKEMSILMQELELKDIENRKIIGSLQNRAPTMDVVNTTISEPAASIGSYPDVSVRRIGPDSITSDFFTSSRYYVHMSADYRTMIIVPNLEGDVVCIDNTITLMGLSAASPFSEPYDMLSEYSPHYGGVQIHLK